MNDKLTLLAIALGALSLGGCSYPEPKPQAPATQADFVAAPDQARIFIFVSYDSPAARNYFADAFRIHVDGGYSADLNDRQFVVEDELPGGYSIDIDMIDWTNAAKAHATLQLNLKPGEIAFVKARVAADRTLSEAPIDKAQGMREIIARQRICAC